MSYRDDDEDVYDYYREPSAEEEIEMEKRLRVVKQKIQDEINAKHNKTRQDDQGTKDFLITYIIGPGIYIIIFILMFKACHGGFK